LDALHVDQRRSAGNRNRFLERTDTQLRVESDGHGALQPDPFTAHGAETGEREVHRVFTGAQIDDAVQPGAIRDRRSHSFDQDGTRHFNGDPRQYRA
jgi:hypothetical protein